MKYAVIFLLTFYVTTAQSQWSLLHNYPSILTDIVFDEDDNMYTVFQNGLIRMNGDTLMVVPVYNFNECGLLSATFYRDTLVYNASATNAQHIIMNGGDTLLSIPYTGTIHRAGTLIADGDTLYIACGSGTMGGDAQDTTNLRGKIVKIYPPDYEPEIFCYGLRNPWQIYKHGNKFFIGDVGSDYYEEVNISYGGENFGWNCSEGDTIFNNNCAPADTAVFTYPNPGSASITGGAVHNGWYYFCDWFTTSGWRMKSNLSGVIEPFEYPDDILVFANDVAGNLYCGSYDAKIYRLEHPLSIDTIEKDTIPIRPKEIPFWKKQYIRYVDLYGRQTNEAPAWGWFYDRWEDLWIMKGESGEMIYGKPKRRW